jgi:hypothetical protein
VAALSHGSLTKVAGHIVAERHGILLASEMTSKRRNIDGTLLWEKRTTIHHAEPYTKWKVSYKF